MKIIFPILFTLLFSLMAFAQSDLPIESTVKDLTGKTKVYIVAETTQSKDEIKKNLSKEKVYEIVRDPDEAQFILEFKDITDSKPAAIGFGVHSKVSEMTAYYYNEKKRKIIAWSKSRDFYKQGGFTKNSNEKVLTSDFLKAYKSKDK